MAFRRGAGKAMHSRLRLMLFTCIVMAGWLSAVAVEREFSLVSDSSDRFVGVLRRGEAKLRKPTLKVFEVIGNGERLRELHSAELLNPRAPSLMELSSDGRFLVTMNDDDAGSTLGPRTIVVYDLVRNEHSAYSGGEALTEAVVQSFRELPGANGDWRVGRGIFNKTNTKFYTTAPERLNEPGVLNVVVDLTNRTLTVEEKPKKIPDDIVSIKYVTFLGDSNWFATNSWTVSEEKVNTENNRFPAFLLRSWASDRPYETYKFDATTKDYARVTNDKWPDPDPWQKAKERQKSKRSGPFGP